MEARAQRLRNFEIKESLSIDAEKSLPHSATSAKKTVGTTTIIAINKASALSITPHVWEA